MTKRQPSKTPHIKSWPPPRERGTVHTTGFGGTPPIFNWLTRCLKEFLRHNITSKIIPTDCPPPPDPRITPTTVHGNYPSTQEQLEKDYDKRMAELAKNREGISE